MKGIALHDARPAAAVAQAEREKAERDEEGKDEEAKHKAPHVEADEAEDVVHHPTVG